MFNAIKNFKRFFTFSRITFFINELFPPICFILFLLFLSSFTSILTSPITGLFPTSFGYSFIIPSMDYQTVVEFIAVFLLILLSSLGLILISYGSRISVDKHFSKAVSYGGLILFILMTIILQYLFHIKTGSI